MRKLLLFIATLPLFAFAQMDTIWVPYHGGMDLREGVYRDFRAFRLNAPSVPLDRLRDDQGLPIRDIRQSLSKLYYVSDSSGAQALKMDRLWGFCHNDVVYVQAGNGFYRIGMMGSLAHMVYEQNYRDWDPYLYGYGTVTRTVLMQQLVDMETGERLPFLAAGMDAALAHDPVLQEEFRNLSKKQRNSDEALFRFLRMYNERHPLLFPQ
ncbi:MAG: hypothetical protein IPI81_08420 [Flavobacteriales bacterium]|nr:hypothetical protein [Flavobacteriales bacterium]MCC6938889.1 hypothetical protein [Flavobacteriales bacterium]